MGARTATCLLSADRFESRAHGDFGLAVADIAAEQPVHGLGRFHVALDVNDGHVLIFGFAEFEGVLELAHQLAVGGEGVPFGGASFSVKLEQLVGHVLHGLSHAGFGLGPGGGAEVIECWLGPFRRPVFLDQVEAREGHIEARAFRVFEQHEFRVAVALIDLFEALILPDAMLDVDHVVSDLKIAEVGEKCRGLGLLTLRTERRRHQIRQTDRGRRKWRDELREGQRHPGHMPSPGLR